MTEKPLEITTYRRPTGRLRWKGGVLQQEWSHDWGPPLTWEDVPREDEPRQAAEEAT